jgi:hypothetical protein
MNLKIVACTDCVTSELVYPNSACMYPREGRKRKKYDIRMEISDRGFVFLGETISN